MRRTWIGLLGIAAAFGGLAPMGPASAQQPREGIGFNLREVPFSTLIEFVSKNLGVVVIVDDDAKKALEGKKITAVSPDAVPPAKVIEFLNTALGDHKVTAIRIREVVRIVTSERARKETFEIAVGADPEQIPIGDQVVIHIVPLRYAGAEDVKKELGELVSDKVKMFFNTRSNALVLSGPATQVRQFVTVVRALDTQVFGGIKVWRKTLVNADCNDVARVIREVFAPPGTTQPQQQRGGGGFREMMRMFSGGGQGEQPKPSPLSEVKVSTEPRTNTVIVSADETTVKEIDALVEDLDKIRVAPPTTLIRPLKNADASNVSTILTELFRNQPAQTARQGAQNRAATQQQNPLSRFFGQGGQGGQGGGQGGQGGGQRQQPQGGGGGGGMARPLAGGLAPEWAVPVLQEGGGDGAAGPPTPIPIPVPTPQGPEGPAAAAAGPQGVVGEVRIRADADSNSIIIVTDPKNIEEINRVIDRLDQVRPEVLIKCFVAEVTLDDQSELGVEWRWSDDLHVRHDPGTGSATTNYDLTAPSRALGFQYQLLSENIDVLVKALKRSGKLKVLSAPRILALDNEQAEINVGRRVPFIRNTRVTQDGQTLNTVEYEDIGIILRVTPHVNPEGQVRMELAPEVSEVAPESESIQITEGVTSPVFVTTTANTTVTVRNNQTVVIGGLIRDRWAKSQSKIPILGDIPLIGPLFSSETYEKTRTELMIFLTPIVLTNLMDLEAVTRDEVRSLELITEAYFKDKVLLDGVPIPPDQRDLLNRRKRTSDLDE